MSFVIKAAAFGGLGLGTVTVPDQHNSPSRLGVNSSTPVPTSGGESTNTAVVTATWNGQTVVALDDATVLIGSAPQPAKFFVIDSGTDRTYKTSRTGFAIPSSTFQAVVWQVAAGMEIVVHCMIPGDHPNFRDGFANPVPRP